MLDVNGETPIVVLVTADDLEQARQAVAMVRETVQPGVEIALAPYGNQARAIFDDRALQDLTDAMWGTTEAAPMSHGEAINAGKDGGFFHQWSYLAILAQDVLVEPGWLEGMIRAASAEITTPKGATVPSSSAFGADKIGIILPVTDKTTNPSQRLNLTEGEARLGLGNYCQQRLAKLPYDASTADVIDPMCMVLTRGFVEAVTKKFGKIVTGYGAYLGHDLALIAEAIGYRALVAERVFVTRIEPVDLGHRAVGPVDERLAYLNSWSGKLAGSRVCIAQIAVLRRYGDLAIWRNALTRHAELVDDFVVMLAVNPGEMFGGYDPQDVHAKMPQADANMLRSCHKAKTEERVLQAVSKWAGKITGGKVRVFAMAGPGLNAYEELSKHARDTGADWILSLDTHEMLEDRVTRAHLARLMAHPDPTVRAWDMGILTHWDSPRLVRDDAPFGDGGTWTGGDHDVLMWRNDGRVVCQGQRSPLFAPESVRISGVRIRRFKYLQADDRAALVKEGRAQGLDPSLVGMIAHEQGMRLSRYNPQNGIGLHLLAYSREEPEDIARWLDQTFGLVDHAVIVWTEEDFILGEELTQICDLYGASVVHHPLAENIAHARNAGMNALQDVSKERDMHLGWALFIDPDEWYLKPDEDLRIMRRMAEASESWGWLVRVANYRADGGTPTISDSVRMSRLDRDRAMRMSGRVHESFDRAVRGMRDKGMRPNMLYAPFVLQHRGMAFDEARMAEKLDHYERLLRLELDEDPNNPGAWVSLGWHYANGGQMDFAIACYEHGIACSNGSYLPFKELGYVRLRESRAMFEACLANLVPAHPFHELCSKIVDFLRQSAPPHPIVNRGRDGEMSALPVGPAPAAG